MSEERLYTAEEVAAEYVLGLDVVLKALLRDLTEVRNRCGATPLNLPEDRLKQIKRQGEIEGLNIAIAAIKRRVQ